jgi:type IV pilus assembly protein PilW
MNRLRRCSVAGSRLACRGFTLVELMIALTIGLILLGGLVNVFVGSSRTHAELKKAAEHTENGSMAMWILSKDAYAAGYFGEFYLLPDPGGSLPDPCATTVPELYAALAFPVQGYDAHAASPLACLSNSDFVPGTDILVIRRADSTALAPTDVPITNEVYLQGRATTAQVQIGAGGSPVGTTRKADGTLADIFKKDGSAAADSRKFHVRIYFIAPCSVPGNGGDSCTGASDDGGNPIPTLKRLELTAVGGATAWRIVPVVEGVQNLQIDYGIDNLPATQNLATGQLGDGAPDVYVKSPATADWPNVVSLKAHVLARATQPTLGYTDVKTYDMGLAGAAGAFNDAVKRHQFASVMRIINVSGRREIPQ